MRLFVALSLPPLVVAELRDAVDALRRDAPELRWVDPSGWHLTLAFLGEVKEKVLPELTERLGRAARRHPPQRLAITGGGRFGDRVLWAAVTGDREPLRRLAGSVAAAARRSGIAVDDRPYKPHLTLARSRGSADLRPLAAALSTYAGSAWTATELHLIHSRLGAGGARYETVATWALGARAPDDPTR